MRVAKLAMELMMPVTMAHASLLPWAVPGVWTIGPIPFALTMAQMKKARAANGTKKALTVKRCRILWTGNQMAGKLQTQKMKKLRKSRVLVPELSGMLLGRCSYTRSVRCSLTQWGKYPKTYVFAPD